MVNMTKSPTEPDPEVEAKRKRIRESLQNVGKALAKHEEAAAADRKQRRSLIMLALEGADKGDNAFTYDELAAITGLTRGAIYKIMRDGFKEAPLSEQRSKATKG